MCSVFELTAGGHAANGGAAMRQEEGNDGKPSLLLKPLDKSEQNIYESLEATWAQDPVRRFIPGFHGISMQAGDAAVPSLRLENLVHGVAEPKVMDVKLGARTFLQSEGESAAPRSDLFKKLVRSSPSALTSTELTTQAVTKRRYMETRDANSTSRSLGFKIVGTACHEGREASTDEQRPAEAFRAFAKSATPNEDGPLSPRRSPASVAWKLVGQLLKLRDAMEASAFVQNHELVGTSVLLIVDATCGTCSVSWIDFAKVRVCISEHGLSHRKPAEHGSQEEGLLTGLDSLISIWVDVARSFGMDVGSLEACQFLPPRKCSRVRLMSPGTLALMTRLGVGNVRKCARVRLTAPYTDGLLQSIGNRLFFVDAIVQNVEILASSVA